MAENNTGGAVCTTVAPADTSHHGQEDATVVDSTELAAGEGVPEEASSESDDEPSDVRQIPSYPFPAEFHLEFQDSRIEVIRHLGQRHPRGTRAIVIFFPGVHGGVGPCRTPPEQFDPDALYPSVARGLVGEHDADVDCYRCSWPFMRPRMAYAVGGACRVLHHGLLEAMRGHAPDAGLREISVLFVGHSLGGSVAIQATEVVARHFGADGRGGQQMEGLENCVVRVSGVCTLNGALDVRQVLGQGSEPFSSLSKCRALLISGDADQVVPPEATAQLFEALPTPAKRHLVMPGGTHDLFAHKAQLIDELTGFLLEGL